jgi:hypothetical protein
MASQRPTIRLSTESPLRSAAIKWWYWWIWAQIPCTTETKMEEEIHPGPRRDRFGDPYYIHYWGKAREGLHYPCMRIIRKIEQRIPGTLRQILSPFWLLLDSADPFTVWRTIIREHADVRLASLMSDAAKDHESAGLLYLMHDQYEGADRLLILAGAYLEFEKREAFTQARRCIDTMISELLRYQSHNLASDHTNIIFEHCRSRLWATRDARDHLNGFDFGIARQLNQAVFEIQKDCNTWQYFCRGSPSTITSPGSFWRDFSCPAPPFALGLQATEAGFRLHVAKESEHGSEAFRLPERESLHFERLPIPQPRDRRKTKAPRPIPKLYLIAPKAT